MTTEIQTLPAPKIYTPPWCGSLAELPDGQIRCGIQGPPFEGKTTAALTFPNPIILSFDRKVTAHNHRTDVILVPFHDVGFVDKIVKRDGILAPPNRKEALIKWLNTEGIKLTTDQTLILDGSTGIEESYHLWFKQNESALAVGRDGSINSFAEWKYKNNYFEELHSCLKSVPCNVIYITHEAPDRDKKGELNGKIRPLLTGQSGDKLAGNFTDFFRAIAISKPATPEQRKKVMDWGKIDEGTLNEWIASTPSDHSTVYLWQTQSDELCDCGTSSMRGCPKYVIASYKTFSKYRTQRKG